MRLGASELCEPSMILMVFVSVMLCSVADTVSGEECESTSQYNRISTYLVE